MLLKAQIFKKIYIYIYIYNFNNGDAYNWILNAGEQLTIVFVVV